MSAVGIVCGVIEQYKPFCRRFSSAGVSVFDDKFTIHFDLLIVFSVGGG